MTALETSWEWRTPSYGLFFRGIVRSIEAFFWSSELSRMQRVLRSLLLVGVLMMVYIMRHLYQPIGVVLLTYLDLIVATVLFYAVAALILRRWCPWRWGRALAAFVGMAGFLWLLAQGAALYRYIGQYHQYNSLALAELSEMALTDPAHERVLPLNGVHTIARGLRDQTERVTIPNFVRRHDGRHCWSMAVQPDRFMQQFNDPVDEILCVIGTEATPDLSRRGLISVNFEVGENLLWGRNTDTCVRRALGPWRYFNYEPSRPVFIERAPNDWVQVVPWIKWQRTWLFFFPRPVFGGVQVIEQSPKRSFLYRLFVDAPTRALVGCGTWVRPHEISRYAYLRGQNLMPEEVSRSIAESFRFQEGITAPWQIFRGGDVRIADIPQDDNKQPYVSFYRIPRGGNRLYDSFALEPKDPDKKVLVTSLFVPSDGVGPSFVYRHSRRNEAPLGVTAVPTHVRADRGDWFWADRRPVESRYFVRDLADSNGAVKRRIMYITTIALVEKQVVDGRQEFTTGGIPAIAITDSTTRAVEWVDPLDPGSWEQKAQAKFGPLWAERRHATSLLPP